MGGLTVNHCAIAAANADAFSWSPEWREQCRIKRIQDIAQGIVDMPTLEGRRKAMAGVPAGLRDEVEREVSRLWAGRKK